MSIFTRSIYNPTKNNMYLYANVSEPSSERDLPQPLKSPERARVFPDLDTNVTSVQCRFASEMYHVLLLSAQEVEVVPARFVHFYYRR